MINKLLLGFFLLFTIKCATDADLDRQTKVQACLNLLKAALHHDSEYFSVVTATIDANDVNDLEKKFVSKTILNCYYTVSLIKSAELIHKKFENISPFAKENIEILKIKPFDEQKLARDTARVENILKELEPEYKEYVNMVQTSAKEFAGVFNNKQEKQNKERIESEKFGDYEYGNSNLSFIRKMDPTIKYSVGFGFLAVMFLSIYWGLTKLMKKEEVPKKKKKN